MTDFECGHHVFIMLQAPTMLESFAELQADSVVLLFGPSDCDTPFLLDCTSSLMMISALSEMRLLSICTEFLW